MKWITLVGRIGTVILAIGLALLLAWLIPSGAGYPSGWGQPIEPEQYMLEELGVYAPPTGLQISVNSTDNVHVYLVGISPDELDNWKTLLKEAYPDSDPYLEMFIESYAVPLIFFHEAYPEEILPDLEDPLTWDVMWDIAVLDRGLQAHPEIILWESPPATSLSHEFFPTDVLPIWAIVANPSPDTVTVEIKVSDLTALAPKERVILPAILLISIGVALAIPWLISRKVKKSTFS